jgi:hypothetical protein
MISSCAAIRIAGGAGCKFVLVQNILPNCSCPARKVGAPGGNARLGMMNFWTAAVPGDIAD